MGITKDQAVAAVCKVLTGGQLGQVLALLDKLDADSLSKLQHGSITSEHGDAAITSYVLSVLPGNAGAGASAGTLPTPAADVSVSADSKVVDLLQVLVSQQQVLVSQQHVVATNTSIMVSDQLSHKHRYTTGQATQYRDPGFKANLVEAYQCEAGAGKLRCLLLNEPFESELVCGSHLFKLCWHEDVFATLGFQNINDPRNGLLLLKPLEEAFDNGYLVFIVDGDQFKAHWLGDDKPKIAHFKTYPWKSNEKLSDAAQQVLRKRFEEATFKSVVERKSLVFTSDHRPYKRCLSYQARKASAVAVQMGRISSSWAEDKNLVYHSPAATNIERYFKSIPAGGAAPPLSDLDEESDEAL